MNRSSFKNILFSLLFFISATFLFGFISATYFANLSANVSVDAFLKSVHAPVNPIKKRILYLTFEQRDQLLNPPTLCSALKTEFYTRQLTDQQKIRELLVPIYGPEQLKSYVPNENSFGGYIIVGTYQNEQEVVEGLSKLSDDTALIGIDSEGGAVKRLSWYQLQQLSTLKNLEEASFCEAVKKDSDYLRSLGFNWMVSPVSDLPTSESDWIYSRSIDLSKDVVSEVTARYVECLNNEKIFSTPKHFPGHGATIVDSHTAIPQISLTYKEWSSTSALPFKAAVDSNAPMIMLGHLKYSEINEEVSSLSSFWIDEELRGNMGFAGIVITDDIAMLRPTNPSECSYYISQAFKAGNDMVMFADSKRCPAEEIVNTLDLDGVDIESKVNRVMETKQRYLCQ